VDEAADEARALDQGLAGGAPGLLPRRRRGRGSRSPARGAAGEPAAPGAPGAAPPAPAPLPAPQADENDAAVLDARWAEMLRQRGAAKPAAAPPRAGKRARTQAPAAPAPAAAPAPSPPAEAIGPRPAAAAPAAAPAAARPLRLVGAEREAALLAPLQALWEHREGAADASAALVAALQAEGFPGHRGAWAADLARAAGAQGKPGLALRLAGLVAGPA